MEKPRPEHPSTYFVQDRSNQDELIRLQIQDQMLTAMMGGVLPEQPTPISLQRVLDVGCGTGGWLIEVAKAYPEIQLLIGVDASKKMVDYAREQAIAQGVSDRVEFHVMDALRMLEFPNQFFDLVNHRLGIGWMRTWEWPKLLAEYQRVTRRGKVIRITEGGDVESNSAALTQLFKMGFDVLHQSGHLFTPTHDGLTSHLAPLLHQQGLQQVQTCAYALHYHAGTPECQSFTEDLKYLYQNLLPFFRRWTQVPDDYQASYQQMLADMQSPDFVATWHVLTAWGTPSEYAQSSSRD